MRLPTRYSEERRQGIVDSEEFDIMKHAMDYGKVSIGSILPTSEETKLVELARQRVTDSATSRRPHEAKYRDSAAFWLGDQWREWGRNDWIDLRNLTDPYRVYAVVNRIRPAVRKHLSRALSARTGITVSPALGRKVDKNSARQARALADHFEEILDDAGRMMKARFLAHVFGPVFEYSYYDPETLVPVPEFDANGEVVDITDRKYGEVCGEIKTWMEVFPDPRSEGEIDDDAEWVVLSSRRSINYAVQKWPHLASCLSLQSGSREVETNQNWLDNLEGDRPKATESGGKFVNVLTTWNQPSDEYPEGLYYTVVGDRIGYIRDWPYKKLRHQSKSNRFLFPVTKLVFQEGINTVWGDTLVQSAVDIQRSINRLISKIDEHTKNGDGKILAARGNELEADAFKSGKRNEIIEWTPTEESNGIPPGYLSIPPLDASIVQLLTLLNSLFDEAMEVGDVSRGKEPFAGASGAAIQALQDSDSSSAALFLELYKRFIKSVTYKRLKIAEEYYVTPRLIYVQDTAPFRREEIDSPNQIESPIPPDLTGIPLEIQQTLAEQKQIPIPGAAQTPDQDSPSMQAEDFSDFGIGRWKLDASVSTARTPAQRVEIILQMAKIGMFLPENIPTTLAILAMMEVEQSDKLTSDLIAALKMYQARQDEIAKQAQEADAAQKSNEVKDKTEADMVKQQQKSEDEDSHQQTKAQADIALEQARHEAKLREIALEHKLNTTRDTHGMKLEQLSQVLNPGPETTDQN